MEEELQPQWRRVIVSVKTLNNADEIKEVMEEALEGAFFEFQVGS